MLVTDSKPMPIIVTIINASTAVIFVRIDKFANMTSLPYCSYCASRRSEYAAGMINGATQSAASSARQPWSG
ncbi:hypothetical protein [Rhodopseudomonas pseudopalustris]|uniref:hypothetical protein n=1 Tax=Rhodopseudomonas pseudopalustris TaxID=1513892 RepID=UPI003F987533